MKRGKFLKAFVGLPLVLPLLSFEKRSKPERRLWKPEDITAGLYITRNYDADIRKHAGLITTVTFQIGYNLSLGRKSFKWQSVLGGEKYLVTERFHDSKCQYTMNSIADGWNHGNCEKDEKGEYQPFIAYTKESLCDHLNSDEHGYRPTTKEEMHIIIDNMSKNFLNG